MNKVVDANDSVKYIEIIESIDVLDNVIDKIDFFEDSLKSLESNEQDMYRKTFYREFIEKNIENLEYDTIKKMIDYILDLSRSFEDNFVKYSIIMDTSILYAIKLYYTGDVTESKKYFQRAITYAESRLDFARQEYFDSLNCAYSWAGVIYFQEGKVKDAYKCFEKAIENYDSVKSDPNYFVREAEIISICRNYINMISLD